MDSQCLVHKDFLPTSKMSSAKRTAGRSPLKDVSNTGSQDCVSIDDVVASTISTSPAADPKERKRQRDRDRYAQMSVDKKADFLKKLRETRQQKKARAPSSTATSISTQISISTDSRLASGQSAITKLRRTPFAKVMPTGPTQSSAPAYGIPSTSLPQPATACSKENLNPANDYDWLRRNDMYQLTNFHVRKRAYNGTYADRGESTFSSFSNTIGGVTPPSGAVHYQESNISSPQTRHCQKQFPVLQPSIGSNQLEPFTSAIQKPAIDEVEHYMHIRDIPPHNTIDDVDQPADAYGIFEPVDEPSNLEECSDGVHRAEAGYDDDEEIRLFSAQDVDFESYRVEQLPIHGIQIKDTYDNIYKDLQKKHHVLKSVRDCSHCGAMRFQFEGPAFCCRKGKVKIFIPEVPDELRRLFTSQDDEDAQYFRQHIRYFNSHFSFTSLGVTLDHRVSSAAGTGIYTFRAHGQLYHRLDQLIPGCNGPRHLQLYIYDTDETLSHRVQRSPDLDINLIRNILRILDPNPYVQTFKSIGSVPNLDEYRISLNTDITLDQRRYNAPTTSQVAAIWVEGTDTQNCFDRSVIVYGRGDRPLYIRAYHGCYDPLAYPLFFPGGETGWNRRMPYNDAHDDTFEDQGCTSTQHEDLPTDDHHNYNQDDDFITRTGDVVDSTRYVSAREYYCFKLQVRKAIYLPEPVFSHGQLYVALSRGVSRRTTRILAKPNKEIDPMGKSTKNIVYRDVLLG